MKHRLFVLLIGLFKMRIGFVFLIVQAFAFNSLFSQSYTASTFNEIDGLPSNYVFAINQFKDGKLLAVTKNGPCTYDGSNWERFDYSLVLPSSLNTRIKRGKNGRLWLAGFKNHTLVFGHFEENVWHEHSTPSIEDKNAVQYSLAFDYKESKEGHYSIIFSIQQHLFTYSSETEEWQALTLPSLKEPYTIYDVKYYDNKTYVLTDKGLWTISPNGEVQNIVADFPSNFLVKMEIDAKTNSYYLLGENWVGKTTDGEFRTLIPSFKSIFGRHISSSHLYLSENGRLFFGLNSMIYFLKNNGKDYESINVLGQMEAFWHNSIFVDREENIWLSSNRGIGKISNLSLQFYNHSHGLVEDEVSGIIEMTNNRLMIGGNYSLVIKSEDGCKTIFQKPNTEQVIYRFSNFQRHRKQYYFSAYQKGIGKLNEADEIDWIAPLPIADRPINGFYFNHDSLYVISDNAVFQWDGKFYTKYRKCASFVRKAAFTSNGEMWLLTTSGIYVSSGKKSGLRIQGKTTNLSNVTDILEYNDNIYVATYEGLGKIINDTIVPVKDKEMVVDRPVFELFQNTDDRIWVGTDLGVYIIGKGQQRQHLTNKSGLIGNEVNRGTIVGTSKGEVLIGTVEGLAVYSSSEIHSAQERPIPKIFSIKSNEKNMLNPQAKHVLEAKENGLEIEFGAITFSSSHQLEFRHRLNGYEGEWNTLTSEKKTSISYVNLPGGSYSFDLQVKNNQGEWSEIISSASIKILRPFYEKAWFFALVLTFTVLLFYFIYQYVIQKKLIKQKDLLEIQHDTINKSIRYAKRIQESILPSQNMVDELFKENFILNKPKDIVAGDFYWVSKKEGNVFFAVADCTGHGVPGSIVSVVCSNALNYVVNELGHNSSTAVILEKVRQIVVETFSNESMEISDGMDITFCILDLKSNIMQFSGAHQSLLRVTKKNESSFENALEKKGHFLIEYKGDGQPVGQFNYTKPFSERVIQLYEDDILYLSTDGYFDQFGGPKGKKMLKHLFKTKILDLADLSMKEQKTRLMSNFETWKGDEMQIDDVCVVGIKI